MERSDYILVNVITAIYEVVESGMITATNWSRVDISDFCV
jgi:hypothetical protein